MKKTTIPKSRIPISYLLDYIKEGYTVDNFLASYPWVKKKDVERALDQIKNNLRAETSKITV